MALGRGYHCVSGPDMESGKTGGQRAIGDRPTPRRAGGQEIEATALLARRQLIDVASSAVLVMSRLACWRVCWRVKVQVSRLDSDGT
jgi:hypothetical protein